MVSGTETLETYCMQKGLLSWIIYWFLFDKLEINIVTWPCFGPAQSHYLSFLDIFTDIHDFIFHLSDILIIVSHSNVQWSFPIHWTFNTQFIFKPQTPVNNHDPLCYEFFQYQSVNYTMLIICWVIDFRVHVPYTIYVLLFSHVAFLWLSFFIVLGSMVGLKMAV